MIKNLNDFYKVAQYIVDKWTQVSHSFPQLKTNFWIVLPQYRMISAKVVNQAVLVWRRALPRGGSEDGVAVGRKGEERGRERAVRWPAGLGVAWICRGATRRERKGKGRKGDGWEKRGEGQGVTGK
jgi:hypothetical protein